MKAIILAGGLGTRLRPLTDTIPKPLLPVQGKPIMQYAVENLAKYGFREIILGISYHADKIKEYFGDGSKFGVKLEYSLEKTPLGTGGAVRQAATNAGDEFVLVWGDNLSDVDIGVLRAVHHQSDCWITMTLTPRDDVENFGVAVLDKDKIIGFVEKPARDQSPSKLINAGVFVIKKIALDILPEGVSSIEKQCLESLAVQGRIGAYRHLGQWFPTDTIAKYELAQREFKV
ncbi:MAG: hypothetical protein COU31_01825 [Candidatus Magasanikbacteria bacterium CG10_big_fil_rev_8_21_14_0_10_40_10]|uniref:Nucleotidyl transferase domain-containing protein n=1 Tax=Candidatus Magasanikbacteria bacterium CG10_big_fil_rev_8_21_14_0_10_40_10 TaxID=1974648 RepID=A0A2M6W4F9_9BACT|nr:MAG: hypothetical protein COU31_01825 [Candidatus Magasanikbacteria bacterium CG10_big_fil_rev_8_21_14_0_10_40_10]